MSDASASKQIDDIVRRTAGWRGERLSQLRALIRRADPGVIEEVKWKKPSRPEGVPVWSHDGIVCIGESLKNAVRLTFPKGAQLKDPKGLFNTRLDSKAVRAIDFHEGDAMNASALKALILEGARLNRSWHRCRKSSRCLEEAVVIERFRDSQALIEHGEHVAALIEPIIATASVSGELLGELSPELR
jgi:hypothetical protein